MYLQLTYLSSFVHTLAALVLQLSSCLLKVSSCLENANKSGRFPIVLDDEVIEVRWSWRRGI